MAMVDRMHEKATSSVPESSADLDVKVERLLLADLDHYFQGEYDRAIDLWDRVLFLDRQHARTQAYIERAQAAVVERIRESEELLPTGIEAFEHGNIEEERTPLNSATVRGRDEALPLLDRLTGLETILGRQALSSSRMGSGGVPRRESARPHDVERDACQVRMVPLAMVFIALLGVSYVALSWDRIEILWFADRIPQTARHVVPGWQGVLLVPSKAELIFQRAQRLLTDGVTRAALELLNVIESGGPLRGDTDVLRATIKSRLLGSEGAFGAPLLPAIQR